MHASIPPVERQGLQQIVLPRLLPREGRILVQVGDRLQPDDVVATMSLPSPAVVVPLALRRWRVEIEPPLEPPARNGGMAAEKAFLQELADRWTHALRASPEHWAAVYPMTWRPS